MSKRKKAKKTARGKKRAKHSYDDQPSLFGFLLKWAFVLSLWAGIFVAGICAWYAAELPAITKSANFERKSAITVLAADGSVIARYGDITGDNLTAAQLPPHLIQAVLAIEDRRFYSHFGIDLIGLARAMFVNAANRKFVQGGSTITQQLAKNLFLSQERTLKRKIQEAMLALWLEHELTKDEIISAYLNRVYLGSGTFGVDAASRVYFGKRVQDITLREAATLAGLLKAPSRYSPLNNPGLSKERADTVLNAMVDAGYITQAEADGLTKQPPRPGLKPSGAGASRYYTDWVVDGLDELIGTPDEDLTIQTTFNPDLQKTAEEALLSTLLENGEARKISQGAIVVMRPDGAVLTMVGGRDYTLSQFNRAVQAKRQPGSSFKPFVYLTALERGLSPDDRIVDEPFEEGRYRPENFGGKYYGEVTLAEALMLSLNTVSVRLTKALGPAAVIDTARRLGVFSNLEPDLSIALGSSGVSLLEMTTAYSVLANRGAAVYPFAITKITGESGTLYYQRPESRLTRQVADPAAIDKLALMMQGVLENGTGRRALLPFPASGKTGTSQESRDAWFMGFTDELVTGVWMGNDDNSPMKAVTGGSFPADIWRAVMLRGKGMYAPVRQSGFFSSSFQNLMQRLVSAPSYDDAPLPAPAPAAPAQARYND